MNQQVKNWLHGIGAALIGTFSTAAVGALTMPGVFNFTHAGMINFLKICMAPALVSVFAYLQKSPLPGDVTAVAQQITTKTTDQGTTTSTTTVATSKPAE